MRLRRGRSPAVELCMIPRAAAAVTVAANRPRRRHFRRALFNNRGEISGIRKAPRDLATRRNLRARRSVQRRAGRARYLFGRSRSLDERRIARPRRNISERIHLLYNASRNIFLPSNFFTSIPLRFARFAYPDFGNKFNKNVRSMSPAYLFDLTFCAPFLGYDRV